jgi:hypothetical protein
MKNLFLSNVISLLFSKEHYSREIIKEEKYVFI